MDAREEKGLQIAENGKIIKTPVGWKVPSQSGNGSYVVNLDHGHPFCTCPDFEARNQACKHIHAVEFTIEKETKADGTVTLTKLVKMTCTQEWNEYDQAQMHEQERFVALLRDLCNGIPQPDYRFGHPRLPLSDVVFGLVLKGYTTFSGRRFMSGLREAETKELVTKSASFASNARYLENPELAPILKTLIERSATPLKAVETDFAVDSSGFSSTTYDRWFDHKWGKVRSEAKWVKAHVMCGVKTHIVTSVETTDGDSHDTLQFPKLVNDTAKTFNIAEVSADKAYSTRANLHTVQAQGGIAYIPFKKFSTGSQGSHHKFDGLWQKMWHFYTFNQDAFYAHYHKRSNVETVFSMIKAKFGGSVRSKNSTAQVNEVLCKILCHNICCLIQSIYELGLEPTFWTFDTKEAVVPKVLENYDF
ncbi:MAG: transposase [Dehalococcoidia bacterium]|nr:MAG: transposase [Dehalococcoidia bacterium]